MPPSRFAASPWRNLVATPAKPGAGAGRHEELPLAAPASGDASAAALLALTPDGQALLVRGSSAGTLLRLDVRAPKRHNKTAPHLAAAPPGESLAAWHVAPFDSHDDSAMLAAGGSAGSVAVRQLGSAAHASLDAPVVASLASSERAHCSIAAWHPTSAGLLLVGTGRQLRVWDIKTAEASLKWNVDAADASAAATAGAWSLDGTVVGATDSSGSVRLWDPRAGVEPVLTTSKVHAPARPTRFTFTASGSHNFLSTGFSSTRQPEWAYYDVRSPSSAAQRLAYDGTSPLEPVVDSDRSIVYFTSRTSSALHWADLNASGTQGTQPLSFAAGGAAALAPVAPLLDVMRGEIAKLYVPSPPGAGGDAIVPVSVVVPRRQYIDFHSDLFPDTMDWRDTPHTAGQWLEGQNKKLAMLQLDPKLRKAAPEKRQPTQPMQSQAASVAAAAPIVPTAALPASMQQAQRQMPQAASGPGMAQSITPTPATAVAAETAAPSSTASQLSQPSQPAQPSQDAQPSSVETTACQAPSNGASAGSAARSSVPAPVRKTAAAQPAPTSSIRKTASAPRASPTGPRWSRRFVTASTPLISAYQSLSGLDISRAPDARMLAVSPLLFVVPLSGPGGRLGVHRLAQTGRLPAALPALSSGAAVLDFCVDPFGDARVIAAAEDGKVRVWEVASQAGETQPSLTLQLPGASRPGEIAPHPRAEGLFAIAPTDAEGQLHLLDIRSSASAPLASLDVPGGGAFSLAWRADGLHLALACKDRKLRVFDPRTGSSIAEVAAHASPRSFRVIWLDEAHLLSVGHGAGSARELQLFKFSAAAGLTAVAFTTLDVSPAVLFPHWDGDSQVLFLCAKSEPVAAYEVRVDAPRPADFFTALPAFQHGQPQLGLAFLPKQSCDVQAVEVARALRLTKSELMMVSWRVPRARPELFQDDVFPPTRVLQAATTARAWMEGEDGAEDSYEDLCPEGMQPLSQAAAPVSKSTHVKGYVAREETESERSERVLSSVFAKAKMDENEGPNARINAAARRAPSDDGWGSD